MSNMWNKHTQYSMYRLLYKNVVRLMSSVCSLKNVLFIMLYIYIESEGVTIKVTKRSDEGKERRDNYIQSILYKSR